MKKTSYDLVIPLGIACSCSKTLRMADLQHLSFPYDWIAPAKDDAHELVERGRHLSDGFATWFAKDEFRYVKPLPNGMDLYLNDRLSLAFLHDFPHGLDYDTAFDRMQAKYRRRIDRLMSLIRSSRSILIVRIDRPDLPFATDPEDCKVVLRALRDRFPGKRFDFFLISPDATRPLSDLKEEALGDGLVRATFDYRDRRLGSEASQPDFRLTSTVVRDRFIVRDYRTRKEKKAFAARRLAQKLDAAGVSSRGKLALLKLRRKLRFAWTSAVRGLPARIGRKRFEHVLHLGFNCETAFRFYHKWGFVESSLFNWANVRDLDTLTAALEDLESICNGSLELMPESRMWLCANSNVYFHGRMKVFPNSPVPDDRTQEEDRRDLIARTAHLKEKFLRYLSDGKNVLFVHKLNDSDAQSDRLGERLERLRDVLGRRTHGDWTLLVVCERRVRGLMPPSDGKTVFRSVAEYNPPVDATNRKGGDPAGWNAIFSEFAPARILPQTHGFKFE